MKKSAHPDIQLFDYANDAVDAEAARAIKAHLATCGECAAVLALVQVAKETALDRVRAGRSSQSGEHPDVGDLASFFFAGAQQEGSARVAAHVATCFSCVQEISLYASAEQAANRHNASRAVHAEMPARAWEMILEWEGDDFPKFKPASEVFGEELLTRLSRLFGEHDVDSGVVEGRNERVPVVIISRSRNTHRVEFFERINDSTGGSILKHGEGSGRFDNKPLHVLVDVGEKETVVLTEMIRSDTIRVRQPARAEGRQQRVNYFIIED